MKTTFFFFFFVLISLLGSNQVKAETIDIYLPATVPYYSCEDVNDFTTFVFHKPYYFGSTIWNINGVSYGSGDSIIFLPTSVGSYSVGASWDFNIAAANVTLYSTPPPSPTFAVSSEGRISDNRDTAWMCGPSIVISASGLNGNNFFRQEWFLFDNHHGEYPSYASTTVSEPGTYYYEQENSCGITRDTIEVISLPIVPPVWNDTVFCNEAVSLTLDAGPGWNYDWNTTEYTQSIDVDEAGTYSVQLTNVCTSTSASMTVYQHMYPLPDLSSFHLSLMCQDSSILLDPGYLYETRLWVCPNGSTRNTPTLETSFQATGSGMYDLFVTEGGCSEQAFTLVEYFEDPISPMHCVSTFDPITSKNMTVFESSPFEVQYLTDYILCYKQGNNWIPIDTVAHSIGTYEYRMYDMINDPNQQSLTYAVFSLHSCGNLSMLSDWHKTIRISIFAEVGTDDYILQVLDDYKTMDVNYHPESYTIWIDTNNDGNLTEIGILYAENSSYTISSPVYGAAYYASVNLPWNCGGAKSYPVALSNRRLFTPTDIPTLQQNSVSLYPNPSAGIFTVKGDNISLVEVKDIRGTVVLTTNKTTDIDLSAYASGLYIVTVLTKQGSTNLKLFVE